LQSNIIHLTFNAYLKSVGKSFPPFGNTALDEPWPPLQPVSTALYPSYFLCILSPSYSSGHSQHRLAISSWVFLYFFWDTIAYYSSSSFTSLFLCLSLFQTVVTRASNFQTPSYPYSPIGLHARVYLLVSSLQLFEHDRLRLTPPSPSRVQNCFNSLMCYVCCLPNNRIAL
jgi:hypothetical protein